MANVTASSTRHRQGSTTVGGARTRWKNRCTARSACTTVQTIKPIERRVGMVARRMTSDLARMVGELSADGSSREIENTMRITGMVAPSRSFLKKRVQQIAGELAKQVQELEAEARAVESLPDDVASMSCGMDRMAVRMSEPHSDPQNAPTPRRMEPYERDAA